MTRQQPIPFRPTSQDNRAWLETYAKESGRSRNNLLDEALADLRAKHDTATRPPRRRKAPCTARVASGAFCKACGQMHT